MPAQPSSNKDLEKTLPYNPIEAAMKTPEHARNSMDALEDASLQNCRGPYLLHVIVDLKDHAVSFLGTTATQTKFSSV